MEKKVPFFKRVGDGLSDFGKKLAGEGGRHSAPADVRRAPKQHAGSLAGVRAKREELDRAIKAESAGSDNSRREKLDIFMPRKRPRSFFLGTVLTTFKLLIVLVLVVGALLLGGVVGLAQAYMETTPTLDTSKIENQSINSNIYDKNGNLVTAYSGTENREWVSINEIPLQLQEAFIAVEDVRFYYHSGVDVKRLLGSFASNFLSGTNQGGSTITQQLVKNSLLTSEQTYKRKIQEAYLSFQLEDEYSKDQILEAYMNTIPLGGTNYGVKTAAQDYFGKELKDLTLRECACIAGLAQAPHTYNPRRAYYVSGNTEGVNNRTDTVLKRMYTAGYIDKAAYEAALSDELSVLETSTTNSLYDYPYFVEYVIDNVINSFLYVRDLADTTENRASVENEIRTNGYSIYTTLDPDIQNTVQNTLSDWSDYPAMENESDSVTRTTNNDGTVTEVVQPQASAVIYDHNTGDIAAIVGGRYDATVKKAYNRATTSTMPVGSSIKPIAVYGPGIDLGMGAGSTTPNIPVAIEGWTTSAGEDGYPYASAGSYGPVTYREAIVNSLNIATARVLMDVVGVDKATEYLVEDGVDRTHINETPAGLALGTSGITPLEMAVAYGTIANEGEYIQPFSFTKVLDKSGETVLDAAELKVRRQVYSNATAYIISDILVDAVQRGTGRKAQIEGMTVGGKTGTNQDNCGVFFAGITPYYSAAVWIGSDAYKPLSSDVSAASTAAPLWQAFMSKILAGKPDRDIIDMSMYEAGVVEAEVCSVSGMLPTDACRGDVAGHNTVTDLFAADNVPTEMCDMHQTLYLCPDSGLIATPWCDKTYASKYNVIVPSEDSPYAQWPQLNGDFTYSVELLIKLLGRGDAYSDETLYQFFCPLHNQAMYYTPDPYYGGGGTAPAPEPETAPGEGNGDDPGTAPHDENEP